MIRTISKLIILLINMRDIIDFKPGMIIIVNNNYEDNKLNEIYVVFPTQTDLAVIKYGANKYNKNEYRGVWDDLNHFLSKKKDNIIKILDKPKNADLASGTILYEKKINQDNKIAISIEEIAKKFGYDAKDIYITY